MAASGDDAHNGKTTAVVNNPAPVSMPIKAVNAKNKRRSAVLGFQASNASATVMQATS
jgi:hypothetical protein